MVTINDYDNLRITDFVNVSPCIFKPSDLAKAEQLGLVTVADVLNDMHKGACKSMKAKLRTFQDSLVTAHNYLNCGSSIPERVDDSWTTAEMAVQLFVELDELIDKVDSIPFEGNPSGMISRIRNVAKIAKCRYLHGMTDDAISFEMDKTSESCRTAHVRFTEAVISGLKGGCVKGSSPFVLRFRLSRIFIERINEVISVCTSGTSLEQLTDLLGTNEKGLVQFFLDILDASVYSSRNGTFKGQYILYGFPVTKFDCDSSIFFDIMGREHKPVCGLQSRLSKILKDPDRRQKAAAIVRMAECSGQFDIVERDGLKYFQMRYQYLKNDDVRNERILFENRSRYLSKAEMEDEYNRRAMLYGMQEKTGEDYHVKSTDRIACQNGRWHWLEEGETAMTDPRPAIKRYVQEQGGTVTFDQVKEFLASENITLKDSTIRTYLTAFCKHSRKAGSYTAKSGGSCSGRGDIVEEIISYLRDASAADSIYVSKIAGALGTTFARVQRTIDAHAELFVVETRGNKVYVSLSPAYAHSSINVSKPKSRKEPLHRTYMRTMAVDILKKASGGPLPLKELSAKVGAVIAHTSFSDTVIYKVFEHPIFRKGVDESNRNAKTVSLDMDVYRQLFEDNAEYAEEGMAVSTDLAAAEVKEYDWTENYADLKDAVVSFTKDDVHCRHFDVTEAFDEMNKIMMRGRTTLSRDSYFWLIQELLFKYLTQKTTKIEREFLRDNLAFKYEPFLADYYYRATGQPLEEKGLSTRLGILQDEGLLPARYSDWSSSYTTNIVNTRNRVHTSRRDFDSTIRNDILQFVVLYLYTASKGCC